MYLPLFLTKEANIVKDSAKERKRIQSTLEVDINRLSLHI